MNYGVQHPLFSWVCVHAAWLLNRFQRAVKSSPFALVNGRRYSGRLVGFDKKFWPSTGVAISMVHNGFRLGKTTDGSGDLRVVSTPNGLVKSSVIRRTPKPWNPVYTSMVTDLPYKLTEVQKERAKDCSWTCSRTQNVERYAVDHGDSEEEQPTMDMGQPNQQETEFEQTPSSKKNFKTLVRQASDSNDTDFVFDAKSRTKDC